jgi:Mg-chelatase subunit ChlD
MFTFFLITIFTAGASAQSAAARPTPTPSDDQVEKVFTEEIRLNISALDNSGKFAPDVKKEDLVISEDGRLHQADSLRSVPANVLILLDTGGEERRIKGMEATRRVAKSLLDSLKKEDSVAVMEYNDKVNVLAEWTTNKEQLQDVLDRKLGFGKRSCYVEALETARKFMERAPQENRHIVIVTDGIDSVSTPQERAAAIRDMLTTSINVHVLSYTLMERNDLPIKGKGVFQKGGGASNGIPPDILITMPGPIQNTANLPTIVTINLDRAMIKKYKKHAEDLKKAEAELTQLSEDTNGEIFLPLTPDEMQQKTEALAKNIDSQYTLTYTPKRPLNETQADETRSIEVTSRRPGLTVQGRRKLVVKKQ